MQNLHNIPDVESDFITEKDFLNMLSVEGRKAWRAVKNPSSLSHLLIEKGRVTVVTDLPLPADAPPAGVWIRPGVDSQDVPKRKRGRPKKLL